MLQNGARRPRQHFSGQMLRRPVAARGERQSLARLGRSQRVVQLLQRRRCRHHEDGRHERHVDHRREVPLGREAQIPVDPGIDRERAVHHQQRVAIGRRFRDDARADVAAGAGAVLHHHWLPQLLLQVGADAARQQIGAAAGRERHDDGDRVRGVGRVAGGFA
ncbi:hypothetical protein G6F65_020493 [Rhizopus arrhizus]|nr:hypothetical protein G6F65_020493 [Rhizopus arrhizus]